MAHNTDDNFYKLHYNYVGINEVRLLPAQALAKRGPLPSYGARGTFEGTNNLGCNPATIEVARLGARRLLAYIASVHGGTVEGNVVGHGGKARGGCVIAPPNILGGFAIDRDGPIGSHALPLAEGGAWRSFEILHFDICRRDVIHWRMARLQHAKRPVGVGYCEVVENYPDSLFLELQPWWARIIPH